MRIPKVKNKYNLTMSKIRRLKIADRSKVCELIFAQDGEVFDLEGLQTLVLGGAYSVDKWYRLQSGYHWFENEQIPEQRRKSILKNVK